MSIITAGRIAGLLCVYTVIALAQTASPPEDFNPVDELVVRLKDPGVDQTSPGDIAAVLTEGIQEFAVATLGPTVFLSLVEKNRLDKQVGSTSGSNGTTNIVSRGSVPQLLGLAVENGAAYQTATGNTITFRLNPGGLVRALVKQSYLLSGPPADPSGLDQIVNRVSFSTSFDTQRGPAPGTFTGERSQVTEVTARINIINHRDPRERSNWAEINRIRASMGGFVQAVSKYFGLLRARPEYASWRDSAAKRLVGFRSFSDAKLKAELRAISEEFTFQFDSALRPHATRIVEELEDFRESRDKILTAIAKRPTLAFEYAYNRQIVPASVQAALPANFVVPDLSTARLIFGVGSAHLEFSANASVTTFNNALPEMQGHLRDIQGATSMDIRLPRISGIGAGIVTASWLGVYLKQQPFAIKVKVRDKETADGFISVFQGKLTFPMGDSGFRLPIAVTHTNRTEFQDLPDTRGNIGLMFDLDKLFAK
jgi:hypothetical protein